MTLRAVRQCPVDPTPVVEEWIDLVELRFRYGDAVVRQDERAGGLDDAAAAARRVPARRGARARGRGARGRAGRGRAREHRRARRRRAGDGRRDRRRGRRERHHRRRPSGSARGSSTASPTRGTSRTRRCRRSGTRAGSCSSWPTSRAATPGSSRRAITRTSASAAGRARARSSASISRRACEAHGLDPDELESLRGHRLPLRRPGTRIAGERALLVGDAAGLIDPVSGDGMYECFVSSRLATAAILDLLAGRAATLAPYEAAVDARARAAAPRLVDAQAGARPLAAHLVAGRAHEAPLGEHPGHDRGRAPRSGAAARARPRAAAHARPARPLDSPRSRYRKRPQLPMNPG